LILYLAAILVQATLRLTAGQSVRLGQKPYYNLQSDNYGCSRHETSYRRRGRDCHLIRWYNYHCPE